MANTKKSFFLNSLFLITSNILEKFFFFIINIMIARYLSKENFGEYSAALAFGTFFAVFSNMGVGLSSIRAINYYKEDNNEIYTNTILLKILLSILTLSALIGTVIFIEFNRNTIILILILGLVRITNEFLTSINYLFDAKSHFFTSSLYNSIFSLLFLGGTYLVIIFKGNYFDLSNIRLVIIITITFIAFIHTLKFYKFKFNFEKLKRFTLETIPFSYSTLFTSVTTNFSSVILPILHGTIYSGIYNNAYVFFLSLMFIPVTLSRVLMPFLYQHKYSENVDLFHYSYETYSKIFSIMSFYFAIIFFMYCGPMIILVFGVKYGESITLLQILAFAIPFAFTISGYIISSLDKQIINSRIDMIVAAVNFITALILIKYFKAEGAVLSTVITSVIYYILTTGYLIKNRFINYSKTAGIRFTLVIISLLCYLVKLYLSRYHQHILSMILVSIIYFTLIGVLLINKNDIKLLKKIIK